MTHRLLTLSLSVLAVAACGETPTELDSNPRATVVTSAKAFATSARGSGHFLFNEAFRNFSFHARADLEGNTTGSFNVVARSNGNHIQGDVACLLVDGNQAVMAGFISRPAAVGSAFQVGDNFLVAVEDNGEGRAASPDRLSAVFGFQLQPGFETHESIVEFFCSRPVAETIAVYIDPDFNEAIAGNVQVSQ